MYSSKKGIFLKKDGDSIQFFTRENKIIFYFLFKNYRIALIKFNTKKLKPHRCAVF